MGKAGWWPQYDYLLPVELGLKRSDFVFASRVRIFDNNVSDQRAHLASFFD